MTATIPVLPQSLIEAILEIWDSAILAGGRMTSADSHDRFSYSRKLFAVPAARSTARRALFWERGLLQASSAPGRPRPAGAKQGSTGERVNRTCQKKRWCLMGAVRRIIHSRLLTSRVSLGPAPFWLGKLPPWQHRPGAGPQGSGQQGGIGVIRSGEREVQGEDGRETVILHVADPESKVGIPGREKGLISNITENYLS